MKVAAYQASLLYTDPPEAIEFIREQVRRCESEGVPILCCPEAILGGFAENNESPSKFAIRTDDGQLDEVLAGVYSERRRIQPGNPQRCLA
jgi:5-aminopentanamidase